jgi:hypothetical protein
MNETIMSFLDSYDPNTEKVESAFDIWLRDHRSEVYLMMDTHNLDFDNASLRCFIEYQRGER